MEARKKNTLCLSPTQEFRVGKLRIGCLDFWILKGCSLSTAEGDHRRLAAWEMVFRTQVENYSEHGEPGPGGDKRANGFLSLRC